MITILTNPYSIVMQKREESMIRAAVILLLLFFPSVMPLSGQDRSGGATRMTLDEAISKARESSVSALSAKASFVSSYWAYRSYQASRLPSLNLYGNLASFDRSLRQLQNYETGELVYTSNYNMQNSIGLAISQIVAFTGGRVSLYSDLSRIDEFGSGLGNTWYAQPVTFTYEQPIFAYNQFKWDKKISPKEYERARRAYIETMEQVTIDAARYYFELLLAKRNHDISCSNYRNTSQMHAVAGERLKLGSVTRDEYLQLELRMLNDSISMNETMIKVKEAQMVLNSLLGYDEKFEIEPVLEGNLPNVWMDYDMVMEKSLENSSFLLENEIKTLNAESDVARAKADRGASLSFNAKFGLSNSDAAFRETYRHLLDQEVVGITFSIPIFDWGLGKGRVKEAKAKAEVVKAEVEQAMNDYRRTVFTAVGQFNNQKQQCVASERAASIAEERYGLMMEKFRNGTASVTDLNTAQSENDEAAIRYLTDISNFWNYYFELRKLTLHDFMTDSDIEVDFRELLE